MATEREPRCDDCGAVLRSGPHDPSLCVAVLSLRLMALTEALEALAAAWTARAFEGWAPASVLQACAGELRAVLAEGRA